MQRQRDDVARPTSACRVCRLGSAWIEDTRRSSQQRPVRVCPRCVVFSPPVAVTFGPLHVLHHLIVRLSAVFEPFTRVPRRVKRPERTRSETELWDVVITSAVMRRGLGSGPGAGRSGETVNLNGESGLGQVGPRRAASRLTPRHTDDRKTRSGQRPSEGDEA